MSPLGDATLVAIDPGPVFSAILYVEKGDVVRASISTNETIRRELRELSVGAKWFRAPLAIEWFSSFGMAVGKSVFETCREVGRFQEAWRSGDDVRLVRRMDVKLHLCRSARAKDSNVRQALLDLFPETGGGATPQVGTKGDPGPLRFMRDAPVCDVKNADRKHLWSALAVAVTAVQSEQSSEVGDV